MILYNSGYSVIQSSSVTTAAPDTAASQAEIDQSLGKRFLGVPMRDILEAVSLGKISIGETDFQSAVTRAIVERLEPFREEYSEQRRGDSLMRKLISFVGVEPPSSNYLKNHHDFADAVMQLMHLGLVREISQTVVFTASPAGAPFPLRFRDIEISSRGSEALSRLRFLPTSSS